jgi:lipopolysaccharide export system permease protein
VKILDRYLLREFLLYLGLGLVGVMAIFVVVDVFEKLDVFLDHRAPLALVARYYLYRLPEWVVQVMPIALLLATFLGLGQLNKFNELTAMRTAGRSLSDILGPVLVVSVLAALVSLALGELVVPRTNLARDRLYDREIQGIHRQAVTERADVTYLGEGGRIFTIRLYLVNEERMHEVSLQEFRAGALVRRIDAAEASWDGARWVFSSGHLRTFDGGREQVRPFDRMAVNGIGERPPDFAKESRNPSEMNFLELWNYVRRLRASGARVANYLVDLQVKLAFPLVNLIVILIGAPLATRLRMQSAALGFGLSIAISFGYYALLRTGQALGHSGALNPYVAGWLGDLVFGVVGAVMMAHARRS